MKALMSDLTFIEKRKLEKLFHMGGGYASDFSNRTLAEFGGAESGKTAHFVGRWVSTRGEPGPICEPLSATIPG
jgi:hypothetical protein